MAQNGVKTPDLTSASIVDDVLANSGGSTVRVSVADLATQVTALVYDSAAALVASTEAARGVDSLWLSKRGDFYKELDPAAATYDVMTAASVKLAIQNPIKPSGAFDDFAAFTGWLDGVAGESAALDQDETSSVTWTLTGNDVDGQGLSLTSSAGQMLNLDGNARVRNLDIVGSGAGTTAEAVTVIGDDATVRGVSIDLSGMTDTSGGKHGIVANYGAISGLTVDGAEVYTPDGAAGLFNENGPTTDLRILNSHFHGLYNATNFNWPSVAGKNTLLANVLLETDADNGSGTGFSVAVAHGDGFLGTGVYSKISYEAGIHLEDGNRFGVFGNVVLRDNKGDGIWRSKGGYGSNEAENKPLVVSAFSLEGDTAGIATGSYGCHLVYDASGYLDGDVLTGGYIDGFETALFLDGLGLNVADNITVSNCDTVIKTSDRGRHKGSVQSFGATNLVEQPSAGFAQLGEFTQLDAAPTKLVNYTGTPSGLKNTIDGLNLLASGSGYAHPGASTVAIDLCDAPALANCFIEIRALSNTNDQAIASVLMEYDGTTLNIVSSVQTSYGTVAVSGAPITVSGGKLQANIYSVDAKTITLEFRTRGFFYI